MATMTLTPVHYYQRHNGAIVSTDPTTKRVKANQNGDEYSVFVEFDLPSSIAFKVCVDETSRVYGITSSAVAPAFRAYYYQTVISINNFTNPVFAFTDIYNSRNISSTPETHTLTNNIYSMRYDSTKILLRLDGYYTTTDFTFTSFQLVVDYTDPMNTYIANFTPRGGFIDVAEAFNMQPNFSTRPSTICMSYSTGGTIHYKGANESTYHDISYSNYNATIPSGTLSSGTTYSIYITMDAVTGHTADTPVYTFSTEDGTPVVTPRSPNNEITRGSATFRWTYFNERGTAQYAYEVSYHVVGETWQYPTGKVISSADSVTLDIPEAGNIEWSVRVYNQDNVASAWSSYLPFVNYVPPEAPEIVNVDNSGRPTISWIASNQIAYEVKVTDTSGQTVYESGQIYSGNQSHKLDEYLPNGEYIFYVRIVNSLGLYSDWATIVYVQSFPGLIPPEFTLENTVEGVRISISDDPQFEKYHILRNGVLIGSTTAEFLDLYAAGETEYTIIGITANDESAFNNQSIEHRILTTTLKTEDGTIINASRRWNQRISPVKSVTPEFGMFSYIGASRPEIITSKMRNIRYGFGFHDVDRIAETLIGRPLFYSDVFGNADWVEITAISRNDVWYGNETTLELTVIMHEEETDYDDA